MRHILRLLILLSLPIVSWAQSSNGAMFRASLGRTGEFGGAPLVTLPSILWTNIVEDVIFAAPAATTTSIFTASYFGNLRALNALLGTEIWSVSLGGQDNFSSPAVDDVGGRVVVGTGGPDVRAFGTLLGNPLWTFPTNGNVQASPVIANDVVYITDLNGFAYAIDATNGNQIWAVQPGTSIFSSPAFEAGAPDILVFVTLDGDLVTLNAATGAEINRTFIRQGLVTTVALSGGFAYCVDGRSNLLAINATTGATVWSTPFLGSLDTLVSIASGRVFAVDILYQLQAFDAGTGAPIWTQPLTSPVYGGPVIVGNTVYTATSCDFISSFDTALGTPLFSFDTETGLYSHPAIQGLVIFTTSLGNGVLALD